MRYDDHGRLDVEGRIFEFEVRGHVLTLRRMGRTRRISTYGHEQNVRALAEKTARDWREG